MWLGSIGEPGFIPSWLSCECYFWLLKTAPEIFFSKMIDALLLDRCILSPEVELCKNWNRNCFSANCLVLKVWEGLRLSSLYKDKCCPYGNTTRWNHASARGNIPLIFSFKLTPAHFLWFSERLNRKMLVWFWFIWTHKSIRFYFVCATFRCQWDTEVLCQICVFPK